MNKVGGKIYNLRKEKNLSQEELAEKLNVARFTVSRWETNAVIPTSENIKSLCEFFGVTSAYFLDSGEELASAEEEKEEISAQEPLKEPKKGTIKQAVKKETKFKALKIVSAVIGFVLLAFIIIACGIAAYVIISPGGGGVWSENIHTVNYAGIIFLVVGTVAVSALITVTAILIFKYVKRKKRQKQ